MNGGCNWIDGNAPLLCRMNVAGRGAVPREPTVPTGPIVQESYGRVAPVRTIEYLLKNPYDEALFDYYFTNQIALVSLDGQVTPIGRPGVYTDVSPSPNGKYLLVDAVHRPYSYQASLREFPMRTDVWNMAGTAIRTVVDHPLQDNVSSARDAVPAGIRDVAWRPDAPATIITGPVCRHRAALRQYRLGVPERGVPYRALIQNGTHPHLGR